jgi:hypothetical protein
MRSLRRDFYRIDGKPIDTKSLWRVFLANACAHKGRGRHLRKVSFAPRMSPQMTDYIDNAIPERGAHSPQMTNSHIIGIY